jgi:hypothetical protein
VNGQKISRFNLDLSLVKLGDGTCGSLWLARMVASRAALGPFRLDYFETLLCVADTRAAARAT